MKKILLFLLLICFISCKEKKEEKVYLKGDKNAPKTIIKKNKIKEYNKGDIVYIKPDSLKVNIIFVNDVCDCTKDQKTYDVGFFVAGEEIRVNAVYAHNIH